MPDAIIIGDGPAGLSAALFLAKNGKQAVVFGQDKTPMHKAMLHNYLGIDAMTGSDFQRKTREQVRRLGVELRDEQTTSVEKTEAGFRVTTSGGTAGGEDAKYLIIAAGVNPQFVEGVGLSLNERKILEADRDGRTAVEDCYAVGWSARPDKVQAIISAGDGAAAAIDILSKETGKRFHDFDVVE